MKRPSSPREKTRTPCRSSRAYAFHDFMQSLFSGAHRGMLRTEFLRDVVTVVSTFIEGRDVELWVIEREKIYRAVYCTRKSPRFSLQTISLHAEDEGPDQQQMSTLESISLALARRQSDPPDALFIRRGGGWISRKSESFNGTVMLYPILTNQAFSGHLVLMCQGTPWISDGDLIVYKDMAYAIGVALTHRRAQVHLRERVKELTCLYGIARIVAGHHNRGELLELVTKELPPAWLYPEIAGASIHLDGITYGASPGQKRKAVQQAPLLMGGLLRGAIEVFYTEDRPELDEGPFLLEERRLIDTIARELTIVLERIAIEEERGKVEEHLRHADRLATIGQLSAGVAHEINEPLAAILGFAQLAKQNEEIAPQIVSDLDKIIKSSLHARDIVKKLLLFARQSPPHKTEVNLNEIIVEAIQFCGARYARKEIKTVLQCDESLPSLTADRGQLHQVIINLIINAIQAMDKGGTLTIRTSADTQSISVQVGDTGEGMSEEVLPRIFLPFFTTKDINEGTGLGLAVVHGIVTAHEGAIKVISSPGEGSTFIISFPRQTGAER